VTLRIGITGPIGCGKSTVAGWLGELGAAVVDADRVAREVTAAGSPVVAQIAGAFGSALLRPDGSLDRAALGRIVFTDPAELARLESIVHPAVRPVIQARMDAASVEGAPAVVVEAIKLIEGGLAALCDEVWLVTCHADRQLERLLARAAALNQSAPDAEARIAAQSGLVERLAPFATRVIDTSGSLDDTRALVARAFATALATTFPAG
jgi:dephospho-CoA kinase